MCGILAIFNNKRVEGDEFIKLLQKLQHRGQESFGISFVQNNNKIITNSYLGKIKDNNIPFFYSQIIIGHNRYSTSGKSKNKPIEIKYENNDNNDNNDNILNDKHDTYITIEPQTNKIYDNILTLKSNNNINDNVNNNINNNVNNNVNNNTIENESQPFVGYHSCLGQFSLVHNGNVPYDSNDKTIIDSSMDVNLYQSYLSKNDKNNKDDKDNKDDNVNNYSSNNKKINVTNKNIISDTHMIVKFIENFDFNQYVFLYNRQKWYNNNNSTLTFKDKWKIILTEVLKIFKKSYCLIILTNNNIFAVRDKYGVRPLCIGFKESGWCLSSESTVFNNNYNFMRDIQPGEIININKDGVNTLYNYEEERMNKLNIPIKAHCLFEYIYFLKEDTYADNFQVSNLRYKFGIELANQDIKKNNIIENAIVVGSPSTGIPSGKGYADRMNLKYLQVLKKDNNVGRTFILENNKKRDNACKKKYYLDTENIKNNKIIIVDDSLVRGTTITNLISIFRESGAKEVHIRIAAPPIKNPCYYGIDIPTKEELIANNNSIGEIQKIINANSLSYLSMNSIRKIMENHFGNMCTGCFDGHYNNYDW